MSESNDNKSKFDSLEAQRNVILTKISLIDELNPVIKLRIASQFKREIIEEIEKKGYKISLREEYSTEKGWNSIIEIADSTVKVEILGFPEIVKNGNDIIEKIMKFIS